MCSLPITRAPCHLIVVAVLARRAQLSLSIYIALLIDQQDQVTELKCQAEVKWLIALEQTEQTDKHNSLYKLSFRI